LLCNQKLVNSPCGAVNWKNAMPYHCVVYPQYQLVYKKIWGRYTDNDSIEAHEAWDVEFAQRPEHDYCCELYDLIEVTEYLVSLQHMRNIADHFFERSENEKRAGTFTKSRTAYVAPKPLAFGTGRVYSALIDITGNDFCVFSSVEDALIWLDIDPAVKEDIIISKL
jgi:hypothetical protein